MKILLRFLNPKRLATSRKLSRVDNAQIPKSSLFFTGSPSLIKVSHNAGPIICSSSFKVLYVNSVHFAYYLIESECTWNFSRPIQ